MFKRFVRIHGFQRSRSPDFLDSTYRAFVNVVFLFKPREATGDDAADVVDCCLAYAAITRISCEIVANIVGGDVVSRLGDFRSKTGQCGRIVTQRPF